jgi:BCD family chlorophyll transporter-like MFS transporter
MNALTARALRAWRNIDRRFLPFADAATVELPLGRLLRLSLFQVSVGLAAALLNGTLNRVMIVELRVPAWIVALMVALPLAFAPFRALLGFRSDHHRSVLGWKRVPYIWYGTLLQFGGLAIMPFALLVLAGEARGPVNFGVLGAALAFLMVGAGLHTTQTAGLALAQDLAPAHARPRVVALLYVMLLTGVVGSSAVFGWVLRDFTNFRLIQVIQGAALLTLALNLIALWKQEARDPSRTNVDAPAPKFREQWATFARGGRAARLLVAVGLGTAAFGMQDILLEPYGGQILHLGVGATSMLTALLAAGGLSAFAIASRALRLGAEPHRLAATGMLIGIAGFALVVFSAPVDSALLFRVGAVLIGFGGGLFGVGTLIAAMQLDESGQSGLALGAWGAVQATSAGVAIALGGALSDLVGSAATRGLLGDALDNPATGYVFVYHLEIALLFAALVAIGPLVRATQGSMQVSLPRLGLAEFPG